MLVVNVFYCCLSSGGFHFIVFKSVCGKSMDKCSKLFETLSRILQQCIRKSCSQYMQGEQFLVCCGDFQVLVPIWAVEIYLKFERLIPLYN